MNGGAARSVKEIFLEARELEGDARAASLAGACGEDEVLRRRVEALLRADSAMGPEVLAPAPRVVDDELERYDLVEVIGEGGFGTVYLARRRSGVRTEVAIKILRAGWASEEALARFRGEQRSLEAMDHPGIARVLDAGLTGLGRPYLVMELVRGEPITAMCEREGLRVEERVRLMVEVCRAVQHAHTKGVIHRDLKPSNILAWRDGEAGARRFYAKVIDFGVAKVVEGEAREGLTRAMQVVGTPAYMSPEQARGGAGVVDARSDVYGLGAVLYELLSGRPVIEAEAFAGLGPGGVERAVSEVEPAAPSVRGGRRELRGELDWITMRALAKEPERRYATAEALGADLERALRGAAVEAGPASAWYRLSRVYRRNRGVFVGGAAAVLALVIGFGVAVREARVARGAERAAEREKRMAEAMITFLRRDMLGSLRPESGAGGRDVLMRDVMDRASSRLEEASAAGGVLASEPTVRARLHSIFANTYAALGKTEPAERHARASLEAALKSEEATPARAIRARFELARALLFGGKRDEAIRNAEQAVEEAGRLLAADDADGIEARMFLGAILTNTGGDLARARSLFEGCVEGFTRTLGAEHPSTLSARYLLAHVMVQQGEVEAGAGLQERVFEARARVLGPRHPDTLWSKLGLVRARAARGGTEFEAALKQYEEVIRDRAEVLGVDHPDTLGVMEELADILVRARRLAEAQALLEKLVSTWREVGGEDHQRTIRAESILGEVLARRGDFDRGVPMMTGALARMERVYGDSHYDASWIRERVRLAAFARDRGTWEGVR